MKKNMLLKIAFVCVLTVAASSTAMAASANITTSTVLGSSSFAPSSGVTLSADSAAASYEAYSQHLQGDRIYYSNSTSPNIYYNTKTKGTTTSVTPAASNTAAPGSYSSL